MIRPPRPISFVVVHTCSAYDSKKKRATHQTIGQVRAYHMAPVNQGGKGWDDIGYHAYVEQDGALRLGRVEAVPGAHVEGFNAHTLGICCSGHGDFEPFNTAQLKTLIAKVAAWCKKYELGAASVIGHRETDDFGGPPVWKTCPGHLIDMELIRTLVAAELRGKVGVGMPSV